MNTIRTPPQGLSSSDSNINRSVADCTAATPSTIVTNVTMRSNCKRIRLDDDEYNSLDLFRDEMRDMISKWMKQQDEKLEQLERGIAKLESFDKGISDIKTGIKSSNDDLERSLGELSGQIKDLDKKIDMLENERIDTRVKLAELEERNEGLERFIRKTCIEIRGVPKKRKEKKEDLLNIVTCMIKNTGIIGCPSNEIKDVYRLPSKENALTSTVVTEFTNIFVKEHFLRSTKQYNNQQPGRPISTSHLGLEGPESMLFISEHLTPKAKRLHFLARDFARSESFQYCWISNGRVFLRKKEGDKYVVVRNEQTFQHLRETGKSVK